MPRNGHASVLNEPRILADNATRKTFVWVLQGKPIFTFSSIGG